MSFSGGGWGGVQSHFRVQPNYSVEVVLCLLSLGLRQYTEAAKKKHRSIFCEYLSNGRLDLYEI